ncbi:hypothetical protein GCM10029964_050200 [Kibdelosporangium lantanae]
MEARMVTRQRMTSRQLAVWRSMLDTTADLRRVLGARLQETGLSPADYQVLLALTEAEGSGCGRRCWRRRSTGNAAGCPTTWGGWSVVA